MRNTVKKPSKISATKNSKREIKQIQLPPKNIKRRDFLVLSSQTLAIVGGATICWPLINSMNPAADVLALSSIEVNLSNIPIGETATLMWRGKPIFIRHRTKSEITEARKTEIKSLPDPQKDSRRVKKGQEKWLVIVGVCTHLGCVPLANRGDYEGWFCPCHGSHYDTSGRVRSGPAPKNMEVPKYSFIDDNTVKIG